MKAIIQRVSSASLKVDGELISEIGVGFLVLLGVYAGDSEKDADYLAAKTAALRVFKDEQDKMNLALGDIGGELLVVSNFTICADTEKSGNRPSFILAEKPERANELYEHFMAQLKNAGKTVKPGVFGADMKIAVVNDGPVTIILDSAPKGFNK